MDRDSRDLDPARVICVVSRPTHTPPAATPDNHQTTTPRLATPTDHHHQSLPLVVMRARHLTYYALVLGLRRAFTRRDSWTKTFV